MKQGGHVTGSAVPSTIRHASAGGHLLQTSATVKAVSSIRLIHLAFPTPQTPACAGETGKGESVNRQRVATQRYSPKLLKCILAHQGHRQRRIDHGGVNFFDPLASHIHPVDLAPAHMR